MKDMPRERRLIVSALGLVAAACAGLVASLISPGTAWGLVHIVQLLAVLLLVAAATLGWHALHLAGDAVGALRLSEARHRATIESAGEAIMVIDDQATILTFNRAAERMFGYPAAEMIGTSLERLMTEGGRRAHAAYLARHKVTAMVEAARIRAVHKGVRKRGDVFPFELTMTEWQEGGRRMFTGVMRDVTDHERAADDLRESHARFVGVFENSAQPLYIFALSGGGEFVLETMNEAAEACAGLSRYAAAGQTPEELAGSDAGGLRRALLDCLSSAAPVTSSGLDAGERALLPLPMVFTPMRNAAGEIRAVLATGPLPRPAQPQSEARAAA
jgi:PAS domain S-box-containing protein